MAYKGRYRVKNVSKYMGNPTKVVYRSGWELRFMKLCDDSSDIIGWSSEEVKIAYLSPVDNRWHRYWPDFLIKKRTLQGLIETQLIEIKPKKQCSPPKKPPKKLSRRFLNEAATYAVNQAKWAAAIEFCRLRGWSFLILTEDDIL
jgi:hypothetical protein